MHDHADVSSPYCCAGSSVAGWTSCGVVCYRSWLGARGEVQRHSWVTDGYKQRSHGRHCQLCARYSTAADAAAALGFLLFPPKVMGCYVFACVSI